MIKHLTGRSDEELEQYVPKELKDLYSCCKLSDYIISREYRPTYGSCLRIKTKRYIYLMFWSSIDYEYCAYFWKEMPPGQFVNSFGGGFRHKDAKDILKMIQDNEK
jgi:hypothetical protein